VKANKNTPASKKKATSDLKERRAIRWAQRLSAKVQAVLEAHPGADPDNVRHTLILLEKPPLERLQLSLLRGRAHANRK
jgi:hypothetical protein